MDCAIVREAVSAQLDGEAGPVDPALVRDHLAGCGRCRRWRDEAHELTRQARLGGPLPRHDLAGAVLAAAGPLSRPRMPLARVALMLAALAQVTLSVALLVHGEQAAGQHAGHELASFDLGIGVAFAVAALRPRLSAALAWPVGVSALGLVVTALADLAGGGAIGADEAQHLVAVAGVVLLVRQSGGLRPLGRGARARSAAMGRRSQPSAAPPAPRPAPPIRSSGRARLGDRRSREVA